MFATLIAIVVAALTVLFSLNENFKEDPLTTNTLTIVPILLLFSLVFIWSMAFYTFQRAEQNLTPRVLQLVKQDRRLKFYAAGIIFASLLAFFINLNPTVLEHFTYIPHFTTVPWIALWLILIGIAFDFTYLTIKRIYDYISPFSVLTFFTQAAKQSVSNDREIDLCNWIESLSEISVKSLNRFSSSLCVQSVNEMRDVLRMFLDSSKSIAHETQDKQSLSEGITDKVSYTLFYFLDRFSLIYHKALEKQVEPVCSSIVTTLGKVVVDAANCDLSLVSHPVRFIGEFCRDAEEQKMKEVPIKGSITLVEASRAIINSVDYTYQDLIDPFTSVITQLNETAKESFRLNKNQNIKMLIQPLVDLRTIFQSEKLASHRDTPAIQAGINNVLAEWETLETVLRTMPPIPMAAAPQNPPAIQDSLESQA